MSRLDVAIALAIAALLAPPVAGFQDTPAEVKTFVQRVARGEERVPAPSELVMRLSGWLGAESPSMRADALDLITHRALAFRAGTQTDLSVVSPREFEALKTLTPVVAALLSDDPDARVRLSAVIALGHVGRTTTRDRSGDLMLEPATLDLLARAWPDEADDRVRTNIVASLAHATGDSPAVRAALSAALADPSPGVLAAALVGVANRTPDSDLPTAVKLLRHEDRRVRTMAAAAIGVYGARATAFLEDVRRQLAVETDDIARKTLGGTIQAIEGNRPAGETP